MKVEKPQLQHDLAILPHGPGVYLMHNKRSKIIYIGKAINLSKRVNSYFSGKKDYKTEVLRAQVEHVEVLLCENEYEALILENNLIKRWSPRYNIMLKDGSSYPVIRITKEAYPRAFVTRNIVKDGSKYFGPFPDGAQIKVYIDFIKNIYKLRSCTGKLKMRKYPCLYYHINKCSAPCIKAISQDKYAEQVDEIKKILAGKSAELIRVLEEKMQQLAGELNYEMAAQYRDILNLIKRISTKQHMESFDNKKRDYISYVHHEHYFFFTVLLQREGKIIDRENFTSRYLGTEEDAIAEFLLQYYINSTRELVPELYIDHKSDLSNLKSFIQKQRAQKVEFYFPQRGTHFEILQRARKNAQREQDLWIMEHGSNLALEGLKEILGLAKIPRVIEGFDISHLSGYHTVASLVSFCDGQPDKKNYRHFKIKTLNNKPDDYQSIKEAVSRRYTRLLNANLEMPDLILIDGGKGQVNSAYEVLSGLELEIPVIGLAKKEELIFRPHDPKPISLPIGDASLRVLQYLRDETHRFAHKHNSRSREKSLALTSLEKISGIGPAKSKKLLLSYGSLEGIKNQDKQNIAKTAGISISLAETIQEYLSVKLRAGIKKALEPK